MSGCGFTLFKALRRHFRAARIRPFHPGSKTAGRRLAVEEPGGGAISGRGINLFKPLRRHSRATRDSLSIADHVPVARRRGESVASVRDAAGPPNGAGSAVAENSPSRLPGQPHREPAADNAEFSATLCNFSPGSVASSRRLRHPDEGRADNIAILARVSLFAKKLFSFHSQSDDPLAVTGGEPIAGCRSSGAAWPPPWISLQSHDTAPSGRSAFSANRQNMMLSSHGDGLDST